MTFKSGPLFAKTATQCRAVGARGGRARARNLRLLRVHQPALPPPVEPEAEPETAHEASVLLDQQFPHLRDAFVPRQTKRCQLIQMLQQPGGTTVDQMAAAMGWDRHYARRTFRAAAGNTVTISRIMHADGTRAYIAR